MKGKERYGGNEVRRIHFASAGTLSEERELERLEDPKHISIAKTDVRGRRSFCKA
jgi:hypothetical protein